MSGDETQRGPNGNGDPGAPEVELAPEVVMLLRDPDLWEQPTADLGERVVAGVRSETSASPTGVAHRSTGWIRPALLGAAAVLVFLLGGVVVLSAVSGPSGTDEFSADLVPTGLVEDVEGSIEMRSFSSGLRIELDAPTLPRREGDQFYEGWLRTVDDLLIPVGTFHGGEQVTLWAGIDRDRVVAFAITIEDAVGPDSTEHGSSGRVVLKVDVPAP